ncbi:DUF5659 domain-containing protein [Paenibacillus sp. Marseille-Q4541]|uniref:DUF5659 domain-containing protein n=1 Tax=Paenibacillus sp. Marseille-Q4541 TaxID=2831522 RepID=UPI001BAB1353|nr:DUF5659 domain-containing protein [Paenibacillus sp. Marseille-Q4541]
MRYVNDINAVAYLSLNGIDYDHILQKEDADKLVFVYQDRESVNRLIGIYKNSKFKNFTTKQNEIKKVIRSLK